MVGQRGGAVLAPEVGGGTTILVDAGTALSWVRHCPSHLVCTEFLILTTTLSPSLLCEQGNGYPKRVSNL